MHVFRNRENGRCHASQFVPVTKRISNNSIPSLKYTEKILNILPASLLTINEFDLFLHGGFEIVLKHVEHER